MPGQSTEGIPAHLMPEGSLEPTAGEAPVAPNAQPGEDQDGDIGERFQMVDETETPGEEAPAAEPQAEEAQQGGGGISGWLNRVRGGARNVKAGAHAAGVVASALVNPGSGESAPSEQPPETEEPPVQPEPEAAPEGSLTLEVPAPPAGEEEVAAPENPFPAMMAETEEATARANAQIEEARANMPELPASMGGDQLAVEAEENPAEPPPTAAPITSQEAAAAAGEQPGDTPENPAQEPGPPATAHPELLPLEKPGSSQAPGEPSSSQEPEALEPEGEQGAPQPLVMVEDDPDSTYHINPEYRQPYGTEIMSESGTFRASVQRRRDSDDSLIINASIAPEEEGSSTVDAVPGIHVPAEAAVIPELLDEPDLGQNRYFNNVPPQFRVLIRAALEAQGRREEQTYGEVIRPGRAEGTPSVVQGTGGGTDHGAGPAPTGPTTQELAQEPTAGAEAGPTGTATDQEPTGEPTLQEQIAQLREQIADVQAQLAELDRQIEELRARIEGSAKSPEAAQAAGGQPEDYLQRGESLATGGERLRNATDFARGEYQRTQEQMAALEQLHSAVEYLSIRRRIEEFRRLVEAGQEFDPSTAPTWEEWDTLIQYEAAYLRGLVENHQLTEEELQEHIDMRTVEQEALAGTREEDGAQRFANEITDPRNREGYVALQLRIRDRYQTRNLELPSSVEELMDEENVELLRQMITTYTQTLGGIQIDHFLTRDADTITPDDVSMLETPLSEFRRVVVDPARERYESAEQAYDEFIKSQVPGTGEAGDETQRELDELMQRREALQNQLAALEAQLEALEETGTTAQEPGGSEPTEPTEPTEPELEPELSEREQAMAAQIAQLQDDINRLRADNDRERDRAAETLARLQEDVGELREQLEEANARLAELLEQQAEAEEPGEPAAADDETENEPEEEKKKWYQSPRLRKIVTIATGVAVGAAVVAALPGPGLAMGALAVTAGAKWGTKFAIWRLRGTAQDRLDKGDEEGAARRSEWARRLEQYALPFMTGFFAGGAGMLTIESLTGMEFGQLIKGGGGGGVTPQPPGGGTGPTPTTPTPDVGAGYDQLLNADRFNLPDNWNFLQNARGWKGTNLALRGTNEGKAFDAMIQALKKLGVPAKDIPKVLAQGKDLPLAFHDAVRNVMNGMNASQALNAAHVIRGGVEQGTFMQALSGAVQQSGVAVAP